MERRQRLTLIALAAVIAVVAFVALRPDDEDESASTPAAETDTTATATTDDSPATTGETTPKPRPQYVRIRVRDGKPVGGVKTIRARKGRTVRFLVQSDAPHEVHLHGYDISKSVAPGRAARYRFPAKIDGIFEIELEDIGEEIAALRVEP